MCKLLLRKDVSTDMIVSSQFSIQSRNIRVEDGQKYNIADFFWDE